MERMPEKKLDDHFSGRNLRRQSAKTLLVFVCGRSEGELIAEVVGFRGQLVFDTTKPDGTPRKLLDISRIRALGWQPAIPLRQGLESVYRLYAEQAASLK